MEGQELNSTEKACKNCVHFSPVNERVVQLGAVPRGECRRNPPQVIGFPVAAMPGQVALKTTSHWPVIPGNYWCGEFLSAALATAAASDLENQSKGAVPKKNRTMWDDLEEKKT